MNSSCLLTAQLAEASPGAFLTHYHGGWGKRRSTPKIGVALVAEGNFGEGGGCKNEIGATPRLKAKAEEATTVKK